MRRQLRALIKSHGCPTLFLTLNPADVHSRLLHVLCRGNERTFIDMSSWERAKQVADNPVAAALFFDIIIKHFIRIILRYGSGEPGLFGTCTSYYGTVEAQGRGTLHCHMLIWLKGSMSPQKLRDRMRDDSIFKSEIFRWTESIICCELPGMTEPVTVDDAGRAPFFVSSEDPRIMQGPVLPEDMSEDALHTFETNFWEFVKDLACACNWHIHHDTCWKHLKPDEPRDDSHCQMRLNGSTRSFTELDEETESILLRRFHPWINNFNDVILFLLQCNMDIKFIGSGPAAKALVYYITDYITKDSLSVHLGLVAIHSAIKKTQTLYHSGLNNTTIDPVSFRKSFFI